jgi:hypothetical protein
MGEWKFIPSIAPRVGSHSVIPTEPAHYSNRQSVALWADHLGYNVLIPGVVNKPQTADTICGSCGQEATLHGKGYEFVCQRTEFNGSNDYLLWSNDTVSLLNDKDWITEDYDGDPEDNDEEVTEDGYIYVSPTVEWEKIESWRDKDPSEHTSILGEIDHYVNPEPKRRNTFVDGVDGFFTEELYNLVSTAKFHRTLYNSFIDRDGYTRIGSVRVWVEDETVKAECVSCNMNTFTSASAEREQQERFAWAVIAHGNNHAAYWYTHKCICGAKNKNPREDCGHPGQKEVESGKADYNYRVFYPLSGILSSSQALELTEDQQVEFLFQHQQSCKDESCTCDEWLAELVPALALETAS